MTAAFDYDYLRYSVGGVSEKRTVLVTHKISGKQKEFKTRTEFWGHWNKKDGGWLAEQNLKRTSPWTVDEFNIEDVQTPFPVELAYAYVDKHINSVLKKLSTKDYYGYTGKGDSWRVDASTIIKYKGSRATMIKPLHLGSIEHYLHKHHKAREVVGLEADDQLVIDCTKDPNLILVGVDKDYRGCAVTLFNPDRDEAPEKIRGLGRLYIGPNKKVTGQGRMFLYHQVLSGDDSDEYHANSASDMKWGEKSSYHILKNCTTDKEALQGVVDGYKSLYPSPKIITGWRGDSFEVDWLYVMQENFTMAHMLRHEKDFINVKDVLDKLGVQY